MDFDEGAADQLIAACDEAAAALSEQRGPRVSVTGEALAEFRGPFAVLYQANAAAQLAARNKLVAALEDLTRQVRFAKSQAQQARQDLKNQQEKALWHLSHEDFVTASGAYGQAHFSVSPTRRELSESEVCRPEVVFPSIVFEPHHWASSGGTGTSSAVPDALKKAASLVFDQVDAAQLVCDDVVHALNRFEASCSWALTDVGTFAPVADQFNQNDKNDAAKLRAIGEAFNTAGKDADLSATVELSATSLALAISPSEVNGEALLRFLATASPLDLEIASENPEWLTQLASVSPEQVAGWWAGLHRAGAGATGGYSTQQKVLLSSAPKAFGSLDGIPALARVYANRLGAAEDLEDAESELAKLTTSEDRRKMLEKEIEYLNEVKSGEVQLYLYDREKSRIVEMFGTPDGNTQRAITYVPGTFTSLKSFYNKEVQQVSGYIAGLDQNTVAFVYKDGLFPGEDKEEGGQDFKRIGEANDPKRGLEAGKQLASFQRGMQTDPLLQGADLIGMGHSWGYQNLSSSEIFGAYFDKSISLSGAGMNEDWVPNADTRYSNFVYKGDGLRLAQKVPRLVWDGHVPGTHDSFTQNEYSRPDRGTRLPDLTPIENHSLIASDDKDNGEALEDMYREVTE